MALGLTLPTGCAKKEGEKSIIVKLDTPRYVYEAEVVKDDQTGEITVVIT